MWTLFHIALSHLGQKDSSLQMLIIDYSCAITPSKLATNLIDLGLNTHLYYWILDFLTPRLQTAHMGSLP